MLKRSSHDVPGALPTMTNRLAPLAQPHRMEQDVSRNLLSHPDMSFSSLTVHRVKDGVCLQGVMQVNSDCTDIEALVRKAAGVDYVVNQLMVTHRDHELRPKG